MPEWGLLCMRLSHQGGKEGLKLAPMHLAGHPFSNSHRSLHGLPGALNQEFRFFSTIMLSSNRQARIWVWICLIFKACLPNHCPKLSCNILHILWICQKSGKAQTLNSALLILPDFISLLLATFIIYQCQLAYFSLTPDWLKGKPHIILLSS